MQHASGPAALWSGSHARRPACCSLLPGEVRSVAYQSGETAGFTFAEAARLVEAGVAEFVEPWLGLAAADA
jgi:hypothetical protein